MDGKEDGGHNRGEMTESLTKQQMRVRKRGCEQRKRREGGGEGEIDDKKRVDLETQRE